MQCDCVFVINVTYLRSHSNIDVHSHDGTHSATNFLMMISMNYLEIKVIIKTSLKPYQVAGR